MADLSIAGNPITEKKRQSSSESSAPFGACDHRVFTGWDARLLSAKRVFDAADRVAHLAFRLIGLAFRLGLGIARDLAGELLDLALQLLGCAFDAVLVHCLSPVGFSAFPTPA